MEGFVNSMMDIAITVAGRIVASIIIWFVGKWIIGKVLNMIERSDFLKQHDASVRSYTKSAVRIVLYLVLIISIIGVMGIPMASVVTILASAGLAVGAALQGSLSNLAGGIMLMIFRPFSVGNYVDAAGASGTVKDITLFYTELETPDNRVITIPNGSLMNANVTNYSARDTRRVDLAFSVAKGEDAKKISEAIIAVLNKDEKVLKDPAPFARLSGGTNESMDFTVRAWVNAADYWDVYFDLTEDVTSALGELGVKAPGIRVVTDK